MIRRWLLLIFGLATGAALLLLLGGGDRLVEEPLPSRSPGERPSPPSSEPSAPPQGTEPRRCAAITRSGRRCSREAEPGSDFCWQHGGG